MKLKFIYSLAIAGMIASLSACSNDEPDGPDVPGEPAIEVPGSTLEEKTYSEDNLSLKLNGSAVVGKTVKFTPAADGTASVTLAGQPLDINELLDGLDLGGLLGGMVPQAAPSRAEGNMTMPAIPTAGVLPGSPSVTIPVVLEGKADSCAFKGVGETDFCTYKYEGVATADALNFNLSDVKLKNSSMAGTWNMPDFLSDPNDPNSGKFLNVARLQWESKKGAEIELFPGFPMEMPVRDVLVMALGGVPMVQIAGSDMTAVQALSTVLKSVTLGEDGSVKAKYLDTETNEVTESPADFAQYVVESSNVIRLYINPAAIIKSTAEVAAKSRSLDIATVINDLMNQVVPMFTQGIAVHYGQAISNIDGDKIEYTESATAFYLDTDTLLPLLKAVAPVLADEGIVQAIQNMLASDPSMAGVAGSISGVLTSFPEIVNTTTKIEIGINLKR